MSKTPSLNAFTKPNPIGTASAAANSVDYPAAGTDGPLRGSGSKCNTAERVLMSTPDTMPSDPEGLRKRAEHYRELTSRITDPMAIEALLELADRYDTLAAELEVCA